MRVFATFDLAKLNTGTFRQNATIRNGQVYELAIVYLNFGELQIMYHT